MIIVIQFEWNWVAQVWFDSIPHQEGQGRYWGAILVTCGQYPILDLDPLLLSSDNPTNHLNRHTVKKKVQKMWPIANIRPRPAKHLRRHAIVKRPINLTNMTNIQYTTSNTFVKYSILYLLLPTHHFDRHTRKHWRKDEEVWPMWQIPNMRLAIPNNIRHRPTSQPTIWAYMQWGPRNVPNVTQY